MPRGRREGAVPLTRTVGTPLTPDDYDRLHKLAADRGTTASTLLRQLIIGHLDEVATTGQVMLLSRRAALLSAADELDAFAGDLSKGAADVELLARRVGARLGSVELRRLATE